MQNTHFIGIDVSKEKLDYCLLANNKVLEQGEIENSSSKINQLVRDFRTKKIPLKTTLWCLENTGVYSNLVLKALYKKNLNVWLENPMQIKMSQGMTRSKSDKIDAERIAKYAMIHEKNARLYVPKREIINRLQKLQGTRNILMKSKKAISTCTTEGKRFLDKYTAKLLINSSVNSVKALSKDIADIEIQLKRLIASDEALKKLCKIVMSVDGVGLYTAIALIVTTNEFKDITCPVKYNCYAGLAPFNQQSGKSLKTKARVSHKANKKVKTLLHMAAISSLRIKQSEFKKYYDRKIESGKTSMTVINAIRAKIVARVFGCVRDNRMYQKQYTYLKSSTTSNVIEPLFL